MSPPSFPSLAESLAAGLALALGLLLLFPRVRALFPPWLEVRRIHALLYLGTVVAVILYFLPVGSAYERSHLWFQAHPLCRLLLVAAFLNGVLWLSWRFLVRSWRTVQEYRVAVLLLLFVAAFVVLFFIPSAIIIIGPGQAGVLFHRFARGVETDVVYGEGCHLIWPFNTMTIYDLRVSQSSARFDILSQEGLTVTVEASVRYYPRPEYLGVLHQQVGPEYLHKIILPEVQAALRKLFGRFTPEQIYQTQSDLILKARNDAEERLRERFIVLDDLLIKTIELPPTVQGAIQSKLVAQQASQEMEFRIEKEQKEKERKTIEAQGFKVFNETVAPTLTEDLIRFKTIDAYLELSKSGNTNTIVFGAGANLPMMLPMPSPPTGGGPALAGTPAPEGTTAVPNGPNSPARAAQPGPIAPAGPVAPAGLTVPPAR